MVTYTQTLHRIAAEAVSAIERGDLPALADAMTRAQECFDACAQPNSPLELASPKLHSLMDDATLRGMSLAVKGVGSQGDGSAQILCANKEQQEKVIQG
jgi:galactokinase